MRVQFVSKKCDQCAGKLEYIKTKKIWKCVYCGAEIERQEQYDGLFTIKNVVRQVLLDISSRSINNARDNLCECEKIDSRYIGTRIAKIVFKMFLLFCPEENINSTRGSLTAQIKRDYDDLLEISKTPCDEEEILYEFFDNSDIYATLFLVYDSLNDKKRKEYVFSLISINEVYSVETNKNLLVYSVRNSDFDLLDKIISNKNNIDLHFTLSELLIQCPEYESKKKNILELLKLKAFGSNDKKEIENYLTNSSDSVELKCEVISAAKDCDIYPGVRIILEHVLCKADVEQIEKTILILSERDLTDEEAALIVDFAILTGSCERAVTVLKCLKSGRHYIEILKRQAIAFLSRKDLSGEEKAAIISMIFELIRDTQKDSIINNYLCVNNTEPEERIIVINELLKNAETISTKTINNYILNTNTDRSNKPEIVKNIFKLDINISFFNNLLSEYINSKVDSFDVKKDIITILMDNGLKVDPAVLTEYTCSPDMGEGKKLEIVRKIKSSCEQVRSDTANIYLERIEPKDFDPFIFKELFSSQSIFYDEALRKHLLYSRYNNSSKLEDFQSIVALCSTQLTDINCEVVHLNNNINCNILQAYILTTPDSASAAEGIVNFMLKNKLKINELVSIGGDKKLKFKKYISSNAADISDVTRQLCINNKVL